MQKQPVIHYNSPLFSCLSILHEHLSCSLCHLYLLHAQITPAYGFISLPPPRTAELVGPLKLPGACSYTCICIECHLMWTHNYLHKHTCTSHQQGQPHPPSLLLCLSGEPPSVVAVTSITEVMQGGVRVMWMAPNVTNGANLYTVEVKLLTKGGHTVYANNYTVTVGGMPPTRQGSACILSYTETSARFLHTTGAYAAVSRLVRCPTSEVDFSFQ